MAAERIDAVAQGSKHGLLFVFDRVTGEAALAHRGKAGAGIRSPGRKGVAHAAIPHEARTADAAALHGSGCLGHFTGDVPDRLSIASGHRPISDPFQRRA
jgi:hypothetical protein